MSVESRELHQTVRVRRVARLAAAIAVGVSLLLCATRPATAADDGPGAAALTRGRKSLDSAGNSAGSYRRQWALIIGINYDDDARPGSDRAALPILRNAENDAQALRELLVQYYGYTPETVLFNTSGDQATKRWIEDQLQKLCDPAVVDARDSVVVFFSGHGARIESSGDQGALYPYDVKFYNGRPLVGTFLGMHSHVVNVLSESPARHKLLILDSCYSGEVFNIGARPRSETDDRGSPALLEAPCLQAITSCRSTQVASDGTGSNSPFTSVLLKGLRQLPSRHTDADRIWSNWLFAYMRPDLTLPNGQAPDCRNLSGDGEFSFYPDRSQSWEEFSGNADDYRLLQAASVGSEQGQWWFQEMPWFIPSLRTEMMAQLSAQRSGLDSVKIHQDQLRRIAEDMVVARLETAAADAAATDTAAGLDRLRLRHLKLLLEESSVAVGTSPGNKSAGLRTIVADLSNAAIEPLLQPADWHLLALVQHALDEEAAAAAYQKAIALYSGDSAAPIRGTSIQAPKIDPQRALLATCRADFGQFLMAHPQFRGRDAFQEAAQLFREADAVFSQYGPASFRVFVRCQEARAWLAMNRWTEADGCLLKALDFANGLGPNHYLGAFVHRERAWAQMTMWYVSLAEQSFRESNRILENWMADVAEGSQTPVVADGADKPATPAGSSEIAGGSQPAEQMPASATDDLGFTVSERVRSSPDHQARIAYLHNLHGLAMAHRYHGRSALAAQKYRWLAMECEQALGGLRSTTGDVDRNVEEQLLSRVTNTLERLGDCNLFGDPAVRDLSEALDDYQRAQTRIHWLAERAHATWRTKLFYKQALALSLPSLVQDCAMAEDLTSEADRLFAADLPTATGLEQALGTLTTPIVRLIAANPQGSLDAAEDDEPLLAARTALRTVLYEYRTRIGAYPHRDQLEMCLFAADVLLNHGNEHDRFQLWRDVDLLLSFCSVALSPIEMRHDEGRPVGEARNYLRPYYDSAMTHLIRLSLRDSRKLLRVQWEATRGTIPPKGESLRPTLAMYVIRNEPWLLYQLPGGASAALKLSDNHSVQELMAISRSAELSRRSLPHTVEKAFTQWREHRGATAIVDVECRWDDAVGNASITERLETRSDPSPAASAPATPTFEVAPPVTAAPKSPAEVGVATAGPPQQHTTLSVVGPPAFPFNLPEGFQPVVDVVDDDSERE